MQTQQQHLNLFSDELLFMPHEEQKKLIAIIFKFDFLVPEFEKIGRRIKKVYLVEYENDGCFSVQIDNAETNAFFTYNNGTFLMQLKAAKFKSENIAELYGIWALQIP